MKKEEMQKTFRRHIGRIFPTIKPGTPEYDHCWFMFCSGIHLFIHWAPNHTKEEVGEMIVASKEVVDPVLGPIVAKELGIDTGMLEQLAAMSELKRKGDESED